MDKLYLIGGVIIAILIPHISSDSVHIKDMIFLQVCFLCIGVFGFFTFWDQ